MASWAAVRCPLKTAVLPRVTSSVEALWKVDVCVCGIGLFLQRTYDARIIGEK